MWVNSGERYRMGMFSGRIVNAKAIGTFYGKNVDELEEEFRKTIDYYLDLCKRKQIQPEKSFPGRFNLRVTTDLHRKLYLASSGEGKSINRWIKEKLEILLQ
jgi:predicted HicB family RNase H-like nuclease